MIVYNPSQRFMSPQTKDGSDAARPGATRVATFSQQTQPNEDERLKLPKRANTFEHASLTEKNRAKADAEPAGPDAFETGDNTDNEDNIEITRASIELDDLPIELITLTDRYDTELLRATKRPANIL